MVRKEIQVNGTRRTSGKWPWEGRLEGREAKRRECSDMEGVTGYVRPSLLAGGGMWGPKVTLGVSNVVVSTDLGKGCLGGEPAGQGLWKSQEGVTEMTLQRRGSGKRAKLERTVGSRPGFFKYGRHSCMFVAC